MNLDTDHLICTVRFDKLIIQVVCISDLLFVVQEISNVLFRNKLRKTNRERQLFVQEVNIGPKTSKVAKTHFAQTNNVQLSMPENTQTNK